MSFDDVIPASLQKKRNSKKDHPQFLFIAVPIFIPHLFISNNNNNKCVISCYY